MTNENKYPSGGSGPYLQTVVIRKGMAACTDRIGGAGVVTHGVVGVATQSDAEIIAENKRLREALRTVEQGVPRLVGKSWFPDGRPSKHDQCVHGIWMYEPCEGCTDAFIAAALGETK